MNHHSDSDSNSPNTAKSKYPSGRAQFPGGLSQSKFGGGGGSQFPSAGGGNVGGRNAGGEYGMGGGGGFGGFPGGNQFPGGFPSFPGGYIPVSWPYSPFQGGGGRFGETNAGGGFGMGGSSGFGGFPGGNQYPGGFPSFLGGYIPVPWPYSPFQGGGGGFPSFGSANAGAGRMVTPQTPFGVNVYRPNMDIMDLGISPCRVENPQPKEKGTGTGGCRGREKGKGVAGESSQAAGQPKRKVYTPEESTALAKCWVSVVEDMLNNPTRDGLWNRICKRYEVIKPQGAKYHSPEELRKKWGRLKTCVSRFCDIYENNTRSMTNGRTMDDVRELLIRQYGHAQCGLYSPFKYWDAFLVLKDSPKFQEGRAAGFSKRMRLGVSGNYKSSGASIDLEDDVDVEPYPVPRCRRPMDQKTAMRMSRRASSRCSEVQSTAPSSKLTNAVRIKHLFDFIMQWNQATDPKFKKYLESVIKQMKRNLGMSVDDDEPVAGDAAGDGGEDSDE
ncbi:uncharacterized protein LOC125213830 isoform X1 [Salvia hispanica]|uniref:uncharacterized protein LOC125213830 isoform X1 n=1 Tax=Salvia hispanica TaxID=49212 RepID=UPI002009DA41|nr:uncharacterized protein LOC125213830 isoform X1 [Salvia hispanica]XP_047970537.1 uncharacterized protein LOC125213830 isoform X1 [Salvia hispanica]